MSPKLILLCLLGVTTAAAAVEGDLNRARDLAGRGAKEKEAALKLASAIAEDAARPEAERFRARRLVPELLLNLGQIAEARQAAAALAKAGDARASGMAEVLEALVQSKEGKNDGAVAILRRQLAADDAQVKAEAGYQLAKLLSVEEKGQKTKPETYAEVAALAEAAGAALEDLRDAEQALLCAQRAAERGKDAVTYERLQRRFLAPPLLGVLPPHQRDDHSTRLGQVLEEGKRFAEARAIYEGLLGCADTALPRWRLAIARSWRNEGDIGRALTRYEDVFQADSDPLWFGTEAQRLIVDGLAADPPRQAAAALTWLEAVENNLEAAKTLGRIIGGKDGKRVKEIADWYTFGSAGADRLPGTADDLSDPRLGIQRAVYPGRLAAARAVPLSSSQLVRRRATLLLWAGRPDEVAALARWWMGHAGSAAEVGAIADILASCAVALSGDQAMRSRELRFLAFGPPGPDGQAGTADDLADPLPPTPAFTPPPPSGDDAVLLRRMRTVAVEIASDGLVQGGYRSAAYGAMLRIDLLFSQRPRSEEVLPWLNGLPFEIHETVCVNRIAEDGNLAGLPASYAQLDAAGWSKQPDRIKGRRKTWDDLRAVLQSGSSYKTWRP